MRVLFVCLHNAGRSQMSRSLFARAAGGAHEARSAGTTPIDHVHPVVVTAMREVGVDLGTLVAHIADDRARAVGRCGRHHGLRRRVPGDPGQAPHRLGAA